MPDEIPIHARCVVCRHGDRAWIEQLIASGIFLKDLSQEFSVSEVSLRRHDQMHSTLQPNIDPVSLIREMRYLMEESDNLMSDAISQGGKIKRTRWESKMAAVRLKLQVVSEFANLTNAKKHIDPKVSLPRWQNVMTKIAEALKEHPEAMKELKKIMRQEAPQDSSVYLRGREVGGDGPAKTQNDKPKYEPPPRKEGKPNKNPNRPKQLIDKILEGPADGQNGDNAEKMLGEAESWQGFIYRCECEFSTENAEEYSEHLKGCDFNASSQPQ